MGSTISLILGSEVQNEIIKRFFKGLSRLRPPKPKYDSTWDLSIVLNYFKDSRDDVLALDILSKK